MSGGLGLKIGIRDVLAMSPFIPIRSLGHLIPTGVDCIPLPKFNLTVFNFLLSGVDCSYAPAGEILEYFQRISRENGLYEFMKFNHRVVSAIWDEDTGTWKLEIAVGDRIIKDWCHVLLNGSGGLK